ncbi:helix-turn-helix domain-containing protein [Streptomyces sp. NPDC002755]
MLEAVGVTDTEEAVYRLLVTSGSLVASEVIRRTGLPAASVGPALESLMTQGLVIATENHPRFYQAVPPDVALLPRVKASSDAVDLARAEAGRMVEAYRNAVGRHDAGQLVEVITGAEALRQHLRQIQVNARDELLWFCKAQYVAMPSGTNAEEYEALARGVSYRVVYEQPFFDDAGAVDNVIAGVKAGEIARSVPRLPLRMAIADRSIAVCPLVSGGPDGSPDVPRIALVRDSNLLAALLALFERYWEHAVPVTVDGDALAFDEDHDSRGLAATDRQLLSLLVTGVSDKAIASGLGLSRRTVQRRLQSLMRRSGAGTRMQLAWQAAKRGWL